MPHLQSMPCGVPADQDWGSKMITYKKTARFAAAAGAVLLFASVPGPIPAQDEDASAPIYLNFRIQHVRGDRVAEWEQLRKEMRDLARQGGRTYYHVYERVRGPTTIFLLVTAEQGIGKPAADVNLAPEWEVPESWFSAIQDTLISQHVLSLRYYPELRTIEDGATHPPTKFLHMRIRTAAPGRGDDFEKWLRQDLVPALRRAELGDVRNARVVLGGNPRTWVTASFVDGWPYSPDYTVDQRMLAKGDALVADRKDYFYEFREDLSFTSDIAAAAR